MEMIPESEPEKRVIYISAINKDRKRLPVVIRAFINRMEIGSLRLSVETNQGSIEFPADIGKIQLFASYDDHHQALMIDDNEDTYQFVFPGSVRYESASLQAEAKCPDGKTGNPCVTCNVDGIPYRLCI